MAVKVPEREEGAPRTVAHVLGARVRGRRGDLGLAQGDLVHLMRDDRGHRWTSATVSRLEAGLVEPTLSELVSLMLILQASFDQLVDPAATGDEVLDVGLGTPYPAEEARALLRGERRVHYASARLSATTRIRTRAERKGGDDDQA